ncbi:Lar family restriction alleviation protein [Brucella intermedia]|uniref:Lar family restriction alleviation protein n=1 Tax=Brucella intermedia TaxID=94625 RepID=UPI00224AED2B|nr:Lar family restriction alleviation protein [Brucella intermedia]
MADLLPCPFCGSNQLSFRSTPDMDTDGKYHRISCNECGASSRATFAMDACPLFFEELRNVWNTRPAPAATDTGLVTVEHHYFNSTLDAWLPCAFPEIARKEGKETRELVTRSQAVELLAAERAKADEYYGEAVVSYDRKLRIGELEADNAEKDARIKVLGDERYRLAYAITGGEDAPGYLDSLSVETLVEVARDNARRWFAETDRAEALEAKLAAAQKALEPFAEAARYYSNSIHRRVADDAEPCGPALLVKHLRVARAVLGGKPLCLD